MAQRLNTFISENHFRRLKVWAASTNQKMGQAVENLIDRVSLDVLPGGQLTALTEGPPALQSTPPAALSMLEGLGNSPEKKRPEDEFVESFRPYLDYIFRDLGNRSV